MLKFSEVFGPRLIMWLRLLLLKLTSNNPYEEYSERIDRFYEIILNSEYPDNPLIGDQIFLDCNTNLFVSEENDLSYFHACVPNKIYFLLLGPESSRNITRIGVFISQEEYLKNLDRIDLYYQYFADPSIASKLLVIPFEEEITRTRVFNAIQKTLDSDSGVIDY